MPANNSPPQLPAYRQNRLLSLLSSVRQSRLLSTLPVPPTLALASSSRASPPKLPLQQQQPPRPQGRLPQFLAPVRRDKEGSPGPRSNRKNDGRAKGKPQSNSRCAHSFLHRFEPQSRAVPNRRRSSLTSLSPSTKFRHPGMRSSRLPSPSSSRTPSSYLAPPSVRPTGLPTPRRGVASVSSRVPAVIAPSCCYLTSLRQQPKSSIWPFTATDSQVSLPTVVSSFGNCPQSSRMMSRMYVLPRDHAGSYFVSSGHILLCIVPSVDADPLHSVKWHPKQANTLAVASETKMYLLDLAGAARAFRGEPQLQVGLNRISQVFSMPSVSVQSHPSPPIY